MLEMLLMNQQQTNLNQSVKSNRLTKRLRENDFLDGCEPSQGSDSDNHFSMNNSIEYDQRGRRPDDF
jgi:hypothetical protein